MFDGEPPHDAFRSELRDALAGPVAGRVEPDGPLRRVDRTHPLLAHAIRRARSLELGPSVVEAACAPAGQLLDSLSATRDSAAAFERVRTELDGWLDRMISCHTRVTDAVRTGFETEMRRAIADTGAGIALAETARIEIVDAVTRKLMSLRQPWLEEFSAESLDSLFVDAANVGTLAGAAVRHNNGVQEATTRLVRQFDAQIAGSVDRMLQSSMDEEERNEIRQAVLVKLFTRSLDPRRSAELRGYVRMITINTVRDALRRRKRFKEHFPGGRLNIEDVVIPLRAEPDAEAWDLLLAMLGDGSHPPHQAWSFLLRDPLEMTPSEIAARYGRVRLRDVADDVVNQYSDGVLPPDRLLRTIRPLLDDLDRMVELAVRAPKVRKAIRPEILSRVSGDTHLADYAARNLPESITSWCDTVLRRLRRSILRPGRRPRPAAARRRRRND